MLYEVCDVFSYVMCSLKFQHVMCIVPLLRVLYRTCTQYGRRRTRLTCVDVPSGKCGMPSAFRVPQRARVIRNPYQAKQKYTHAHAHTGGLMLGAQTIAAIRKQYNPTDRVPMSPRNAHACARRGGQAYARTHARRTRMNINQCSHAQCVLLSNVSGGNSEKGAVRGRRFFCCHLLHILAYVQTVMLGYIGPYFLTDHFHSNFEWLHSFLNEQNLVCARK